MKYILISVPTSVHETEFEKVGRNSYRVCFGDYEGQGTTKSNAFEDLINNMPTGQACLTDCIQEIDFVQLNKMCTDLKGIQEGGSVSYQQHQALQGVLRTMDTLRESILQDELVPEAYVYPEDEREIVRWPDSQIFMEHPDFQNQATLINDDYGLAQYGSSAFWIPTKWWDEDLQSVRA